MADLVSRKVLTPLLGQMALCVAIQTIAFVVVRQEPWFIPPVVDPDKSNIKNSENTALFLVSCFEYILSGVVLNAGKPFRQSMWQNCASLAVPQQPPAVSAFFLFFFFVSLCSAGYIANTSPQGPLWRQSPLCFSSRCTWSSALFTGSRS